MRTHNFARRILALLLVLAMTAGFLPVFTTAAEEQVSLTVSNKVADPETLNNWQAYYGDSSLLPDGTSGISTWKAGGVWTDKSVFASDSEIAAAGLPVGLADANAFLVSLSALASNKEVVGQSSAPTDTMLVLDVSGSMDNNDKAEGMVEAANRAIHALLQQNRNNRIGVVLYSGTRDDDGATATTVLLPLDHYTTTSTVTTGDWYDRETIPAYLMISNNNNSPDVYVATGVRNAANQRPTRYTREVVGATYIQRGLYDAWKEFEEVTDIVVPEGNAQAGIQRTPVMILMSDGRPTLATEDYNNVGLRDSEHGNGSDDTTTNETVFLTQLTAAWVKGAVGDHYGTDAMFYTLGLATGNDTYATNVLYPSGTTNSDILAWWTNFQTNSELSDGTVEVQEEIEGSGRPGRPGFVEGQEAWYLDYDNDGFATGIGRSYVDRYWSASDISDMIGAFEQIVDEIQMQSAYSATLVESGEADLDGYITVEDELGAMMQVKNIKGILLGDTLFSGAELAKSMDEGLLGQSSNPKEYGNVFVRTVKERIGITDTSVAQDLIRSAYHSDQLSYTSDSDYSNYIGWYGDADNQYLGFWQESYGYGMENAPAGAKYINKSYGYLGGSAGTDGAADMMHIVVMVHTEIATGHQTVLFKVPSSLIPMITYKVEMKGDSLENATDLTLTVEQTDPIRLLYEVGLPDDVNNVNLEQKIEEYLAKDGSNHIHQNADGSYTFYANSWGEEDGAAPDISELTDAQKQALTASVAESHFIPNTANERFYVLEDSVVYVNSGNSYTPVTSLPVAGGEYYFARTIVTVTGANGAAEAQTQYEILSAATVANSGNFQINSDGYCEVKAGTIRQTLSSLELEKSSNNTDTIGYSDSLWVYVPGSDADDYNVYSFLGNNGKLTIMPASGIQVTKEVTELASGASADEKFPIVVTLSRAEANVQVTDADGNVLADTAWDISADNKTVTLYLADGETAFITGLTVGTTYSVSEQHDAYTPSYTYEYEDKTVKAGTIGSVTVSNAPIKDGSLFITKEVVHTHEGETFPTDYEFDFEVTFVDADGNPIANKTFAIENNNDPTLTQLTTDENGVMRGKLKHGETAYIKGIPAGAVVTVEEINVPDNYAVAYRSRNATGQDADNDGTVTIVSNANAVVVATNAYTPKSTSVNLDVTIEKILRVDTQPSEGMYFDFCLERWTGTEWARVTSYDGIGWLASQIKPGQDNVTTFAAVTSSLGTFNEAGTYTYRIYEIYPDEPIAGMTYDRTIYTITVTVTDVDGQLVAVVTDMNDNVITDTDNDSNLEYKATFTNEFNTVPVSIDIVKRVVDTSNNPLTSKAGFEFVAVQTDKDWNPLAGDAASTLTVTSDGIGEARLTATYKEAGSYYFVLTETDKGVPGWTYSKAVYQIEVKVTDDGTGDLSATLIVNGVDQEDDNATVTFENTYDPGNAQVDLNVVPTVAKNLEGRDAVAGEFTFAIFPNGQSSHTSTDGAIAVGTNDAEGNVNFTPEKLTFGQVGKYEYDVVEINNGLGGIDYDLTIYDMVIEVSDAGDGTLKAIYYFEDATEIQVVFTNTYTAEPAEAVIEGLKTIQVNSGLKTLSAGMFTFGLYENNVKIAETTNRANGTFSFDKLVYDTDDVGTHTYEIREIAPDGTTDGSYSADGLTYSGQSFTVTVEVTDNGEGALEAKVTGSGADAVNFVNTYSSVPASVTLEGTKTLAGRDLTAGEFRFAIYESDSTFTQRTLVNDQITHDADGKISFSFGSLDMGYHYYVVREVIPEERAAGIHYDAGEYHITIQVVDNGTGRMNALTSVYHPGDPNAVDPAIAFKNTYRPDDTSLIINGEKILEGGRPLQAGDFGFELYEGTTKLDDALVAADGSFAFDAITYTADDIGTYTYTVKEVIPAGATDNGDGTWTLGNITYDATVYTVNVKVYDDQLGGIVVDYKLVDAEAIIFRNTYTPDPAVITIGVEKQLENKTDKTVSLEGFEFVIALGEDTYTAVSDAEGLTGFTVTFDESDIDQTYEFKIREKNTGIKGMTYDKTVHTVTVQVLQNEDGTLRTVIDGQDADLVLLQFTNIYEELVTPPLGDSFNLILPIALMLLSILGVVAVVIFRKKKTA